MIEESLQGPVIAEAYDRRGWVPIPIHFREKNPILDEWQKRARRDFNPREFIQRVNVGIVLGKASGGLVDVDLDSPEALELASWYLPKTDAIFGRESTPTAHYLYESMGAESIKYALSSGANGCLLELRSDAKGEGKGLQTVFPGSTHTSGEKIEWYYEGDPAVVRSDLLEEAVKRLAVAAALARAWPGVGSRHDAYLDLAGAMLRVGWTVDEVKHLARALCAYTGSTAAETHVQTVLGTAQKMERGEPVTGWPSLAEKLGDPTIRKIKEWLGVEDNAKAELLEKYVFVVGVKRFVDPTTLLEYDQEQLNAKHAARFPLGLGRKHPAAATAFLNDPRARKVEAPTYLPGGDRFVMEEGRPCLNLWQPSKLVPKEGDITLFLDHAKHVIPDPDARCVVFDWMAHNLQHPAVKMNWSVFIGGDQGVGKDALFEPFLRAMGDTNVVVITPDDLMSGFTDWLKHTKLVVVEEVMTFGRREIANRLKPLITAPPNKLRINGKYTPQFSIPNRASFIFFSNEPDALVIDEGDRRFFVYWSPAKQLEPSYYGNYFVWVEENSGVVMRFLLDRDLSGFNAKGDPPMTAHKQEMIEESMSPLERYLRVQYTSCEEPFDRDLVVINDMLVNDVLPRNLGKVSPHAVAKILRKLGAEKLPKQVPLEGRGKPNVWAIRSAWYWRQKDVKELSKAYYMRLKVDQDGTAQLEEEEF